MSPIANAEPDYAAVMQAIGRDIEGLKQEFPQLAEFSIDANSRAKELGFWYEYHARMPPRGPGWTHGARWPDDDGLWFYINFHDPSSQTQADTQPAGSNMFCIGEKRLTFLILEGKATKPVGQRLRAILESHGVKLCKEFEPKTPGSP